MKNKKVVFNLMIIFLPVTSIFSQTTIMVFEFEKFELFGKIKSLKRTYYPLKNKSIKNYSNEFLKKKVDRFVERKWFIQEDGKVDSTVYVNTKFNTGQKSLKVIYNKFKDIVDFRKYRNGEQENQESKKSKYSYDDNNRLIELQTFHKNGHINYRKKIEYFDNGDYVEMVYGGYSKKKIVERNRFNKFNSPLEKSNIGLGKRESSKTVYNKLNKPVQYNYFGIEGELKIEKLYYYDSKNNIIEITTYDLVKNVSSNFIYKYSYDRNGKIEKSIKTEYDKLGNKYKSTNIYQYDLKGNEILKIYKDKKRTAVTVSQYEYY